jgi:hypothetical protein
MDATKAADCAAIIKAFEKHMLTAPSEAAIVGSTIPRLAAINSNATAAARSIQNLVNPPIPQELLTSFNSGATTEGQQNTVLPGEFSQVASKSVDINNWQEWLQDCIPCDLRVELRAELLLKLDDQLLDLLEQLRAQYLKELSFILNLLNATDVYSDVCPLLFAMRDICIPDLQRIISLLASIIYRMTVRELTQIDLIKLLVAPIFQPLFSGLVGILNQYKVLITDPLNCVVSNLNAQLGKLQTGNSLNQALVKDLIKKADALGLISGEAQKAEITEKLSQAHQPFQTIDEGITAMQNAAGSAVVNLRRFLVSGIYEVEVLLDRLKSELASFLGVDSKDTAEFLLGQYQKILIFRLIEFISALVKALTVGFNCDFNDPQKAEDTVGRFLNDFLGPKAPILVRTDNVTGDLVLIFNPGLAEAFEPTGESTSIAQNITPASDKEVDETFNAIISQSSQPVRIRPRCVFEPDSVDSNKLAQFIAELEATGE